MYPTAKKRFIGFYFFQFSQVRTLVLGILLKGDLLLSDLKAIKARDPKRKLSLANRNTISELAGVGDAQSL